jgi:hypothetical protein
MNRSLVLIRFSNSGGLRSQLGRLRLGCATLIGQDLELRSTPSAIRKLQDVSRFPDLVEIEC